MNLGRNQNGTKSTQKSDSFGIENTAEIEKERGLQVESPLMDWSKDIGTIGHPLLVMRLSSGFPLGTGLDNLQPTMAHDL
ncbi:hypothetical protein EVAR_57172_1 [Eumeta japonica]|uniref:Uncharacterized protein n=1 Tax=Eumeta variegata TaxID=151549 RepID=A0A4C1ZTA0_EUMVA|nr:hypothetical protein EVAR_57172_1 [Eumeta japonica]